MRINSFFEKKPANISAATIHFLRKMKVPVTATTVKDQLEQHPEYPSLLSISDNFKKWKVENSAIRVSVDDLDKLPTPFIAYMRSGKGQFMLVTAINDTIEFINDEGGKEFKAKEAFITEWSRIVLLAQAGEESGENNYKVKRRKELANQLRIPFILFVVVGLCVLFPFFSAGNPDSGELTAILWLKLAGSILGGLLLWFEIDKNNPVLKQICSINKKANCKSVLDSKASKLFNWLSWSEIGFFYFAGGYLFILLGNGMAGSMALISWLNLLALPYTVFSISYQWRIAKQWCVLCLVVQAFLLTEGVLAFLNYWQSNRVSSFEVQASVLSAFLIGYALPLLFLVFVKPILIKAHTSNYYRKSLMRLKFNPEIFQSILQRQNRVIPSPQGLGILLGNPEAKNTIIKVCNPYCGPCAEAHPVLEELLKQNPNISVQIIFTATNQEGDVRAFPVRHLMALYQKNDSELIYNALDDWYVKQDQNYRAFSEKYKLNEELKLQNDKLEAMENWCDDMEVASTPTYYLNGRQLPEGYGIKDLKTLLS